MITICIVVPQTEVERFKKSNYHPDGRCNKFTQTMSKIFPNISLVTSESRKLNFPHVIEGEIRK